ncbi:chaplin [Spirillospora sp. NPDC048819]|uniref:chaplin n=1 Tax=Spirillospora sp. NPDC048819 TaxID=3155268 RepID=UPI003401695E
MRTRAKGTSRAAVFAAGFVALGVTALPSNAFADVTDGAGGVLSGNQVNAPVSAPVDVSGNGASLLGTAYATSHGGTKIRKRDGAGQQTSGGHGVASGNQVNAPVSLPVNVCGNGAGVLGHADAGCEGGAKVKGGGKGGQVTDGTGGAIAGNQVNAPISVPVNVCGNAVAIAGAAVAGCEGGASVKNGGHTGSGQETSGVFGVGSGNQANLPISIPVDVCGNAVGGAAAACEGGASVRNGGHRTGGQTTGGDFGVLAGNQANAPISIPLSACGNAAAIVGQAGAFCEGGAHVRSSSGGDQHTSGTGGILSGNQVNAPISIPVEVCGNAAAIVGVAAANCQGQTLVKGSHGSGAWTSGEHGAGSGNQANAPVTAPADVCGNAAAVVGLASALCQDEPGYGGYDPYYRTTGGVPGVGGLNVADGLFTVTGLPEAKALPGVGGGPADDARSKAVGLPVDGGLSELNGSPVTNVLTQVDGAHATDGLPGVGGLAKTTDLPAKSLPEVGGVPGSDARSKDGLPVTGGVSGLGGLPKANGLLGSVPNPAILRGARTATPPVGQLPVGSVQGVDGLPTLAGGGAPGAVSLLGTRNLPAAGTPGQRTIPGVPGGTALPSTPVVPSAQNAAAGLPETGALSAPATGVIGPVRPVAAEETIGPKPKAGTTWTVGAAAMLAFAAGLLGLSRGTRFGRR